MGIYFVEGRVAKIEQAEDDNLTVYYEDVTGCGCLQKMEHDLVVLSVGLIPNRDALAVFRDGKIETDAFSYVREIDENVNPGKTSIEGVFVAGSASAIRDIPDTILHSGAAAVQAAAYREKAKRMDR
jgi:heterodisulfide reductase subunit A